MNNQPSDPENNVTPNKMGGGIFLFLGLLGGAIIGVIFDQPSLGMIGGLTLGAALAIILWLLDSTQK